MKEQIGVFIMYNFILGVLKNLRQLPKTKGARELLPKVELKTNIEVSENKTVAISMLSSPNHIDIAS